MAKNSTKVAKLERSLATARKSARKARQEQESDLSKALGVLGGAYAGGIAATVMPETFGMPTQGVIGIAAFAAGWAMDSCVAKNIALGNLASVAADMGRGHAVDMVTADAG